MSAARNTASTCPPSAAVRQRTMALSTFRCSQVNHFRLSIEEVPARARIMSATSSGWPCHLLRRLESRKAANFSVSSGLAVASIALGKVQVERGLFQVAMAQQHLDGAQIGAVFEQMSGEAVPQGMRMDLISEYRRVRRPRGRHARHLVVIG